MTLSRMADCGTHRPNSSPESRRALHEMPRQLRRDSAQLAQLVWVHPATTQPLRRGRIKRPTHTHKNNQNTCVVRTPNGAISIPFSAGSTVTHLKQLIEDRTGIPSNQQSLSCNGQQLEDTQVLQSSADEFQLVLPILGGAKKKPKGTRNAGTTLDKRELVFKEPGQEYAKCTGLLGNRRLALECLDGVKRLGLIRGSMRRGAVNRVRPGDFVLVGLRDYQDEKADVIHKYEMEEVHRLKGYGEIDASVKLGGDQEATGPVEFGDADDDIEFTFSDGEIDDL